MRLKSLKGDRVVGVEVGRMDGIEIVGDWGVDSDGPGVGL